MPLYQDVLDARCCNRRHTIDEQPSFHLVWYENLNGEGTFSDQRIVTRFDTGADSLSVADFDADNDLDVLAIVQHGSRVAIYENIDGRGAFHRNQFLTGHDFAAFVDADRDGDVDVLTISHAENDEPTWYVWYENNGRGDYVSTHLVARLRENELILISDDFKGNSDFAFQTIYTHRQTFRQFVTHDLDDDGDRDLVGLTTDGHVLRFVNIDAQGSFGRPQYITASLSSSPDQCGSIRIADLDHDGDSDLIYAWSELIGFGIWQSRVAWYESDGDRYFTDEHLIADTVNAEFVGADTVLLVDIDTDGDSDLIAHGSHGYCGDPTLTWRENK